jgi:hypothetical protein
VTGENALAGDVHSPAGEAPGHSEIPNMSKQRATPVAVLDRACARASAVAHDRTVAIRTGETWLRPLPATP